LPPPRHGTPPAPRRSAIPSFWVNRANLPVEALGAAPDAIGSGMADLVTFVAG
jgi:hypothetical protein